MTLSEWFAGQPRGARERLVEAYGIGRTTLWRAERGLPVSYRVASRITAATGGLVPISSLCEPRERAEDRAA